MTKNEFEECHVLFQQEDKETYIKTMLSIFGLNASEFRV